MIVLDTNVVSELMRDHPAPTVLAWLDRQSPTSIWITAITVLESRFGIESMPEGRRRDTLATAFEAVFAGELSGRILPFEHTAAAATATLMARRRAAGRGSELRDDMIAGIVKARRACLATRNMRHFEDAEIDLIDPWLA